jgi:hypothetical protein
VWPQLNLPFLNRPALSFLPLWLTETRKMDGDGQIEQIKRHFQEFFENQVRILANPIHHPYSQRLARTMALITLTKLDNQSLTKIIALLLI